jgi:hypothetical protein
MVLGTDEDVQAEDCLEERGVGEPDVLDRGRRKVKPNGH